MKEVIEHLDNLIRLYTFHAFQYNLIIILKRW